MVEIGASTKTHHTLIRVLVIAHDHFKMSHLWKKAK